MSSDRRGGPTVARRVSRAWIRSGLPASCLLLACSAPDVAPTTTRAASAHQVEIANSEGKAPAAESLPARPSERGEPEPSLGVDDDGLWSELDAGIQLTVPAHVAESATTLLVSRGSAVAVLYADGWPVKVYPLLAGGRELVEGVSLRPGDVEELAPLVDGARIHELPLGVELPPGDVDDDGIPDPLDVLIGGHKTVVNAATYDGSYVSIPYPGGDVPRDQGVCTDVIVRALRNAGPDLQALVHADIQRRPKAYPMVETADDNIDHRRVKTILPYFKRHWTTLSPDPRDSGEPYRPGDVIFMDTISSRHGPDHIGIVSQRTGEDGLPQIINNWDTGSTTDFLDLLDWVPVTHRFRLPARRPPRPIPNSATRMIVVVADGWNESAATLHRFVRSDGDWRSDGGAHPVRIGGSGMAWGRGLHGSGRPNQRRGPIKREGDLRSPAGVFSVGGAFGDESSVETDLRYQHANASMVCVDDPDSSHYGRIIDANTVERDWDSAEAMVRADGLYRRTVVVEHNTMPVLPGAGSCIFLHDWSSPDSAALGCTAMRGADLDTLIEWAQPDATVFVSLPRSEYRALRKRWRLPPL